MKLLFEFVFLLCLICHTFGQESHSSHSNTNGSPENDHEGDTDHGHHTAGLKCFHCTFTQDAHGYKGDSDCQNPVEGKVNVTECSEDSSCGYWAGNLSIGFTVIRSCILHHTETSQCNEKVTIRDTIEYDLFNGSSPLSVEATEKVQGISESCGQNLCNNGTFRESCKLFPEEVVMPVMIIMEFIHIRAFKPIKPRQRLMEVSTEEITARAQLE
ncbi:unnamed protein product [Allacma fusca]|uniref:Sodefrin-like factor n=1 Tax=Allacma fusca TaxID=39272 RepID=A0A8J2LKD1_9HEXA|nr:unnamed protein product [Allacma fusca]